MLKHRELPLLVAGSSNRSLSEEVALLSKIELAKIDQERFPDGEIAVQVHDNVAGRDVFVLQTIALDPNNYLMELLILVDALKRGSAKSITAIIPYYGYCRQDRKDKAGTPITAKLVANMLASAGVTRLISVDLHEGQLEGFFNIPVDNLKSSSLLIKALKELDRTKCVVVAPDIGSIRFARGFANQLKVDLAIVNRHRTNPVTIEDVTLIGNVHGKDILLADDICSTGATLVSAAKACHEKGANRIFAAVTHGLCVNGAAARLEKSPIAEIWITNTIPYTDRLYDCKKFNQLSIAPLLSHAILTFLQDEFISSKNR